MTLFITLLATVVILRTAIACACLICDWRERRLQRRAMARLWVEGRVIRGPWTRVGTWRSR